VTSVCRFVQEKIIKIGLKVFERGENLLQNFVFRLSQSISRTDCPSPVNFLLNRKLRLSCGNLVKCPLRVPLSESKLYFQTQTSISIFKRFIVFSQKRRSPTLPLDKVLPQVTSRTFSDYLNLNKF